MASTCFPGVVVREESQAFCDTLCVTHCVCCPCQTQVLQGTDTESWQTWNDTKETPTSNHSLGITSFLNFQAQGSFKLWLSPCSQGARGRSCPNCRKWAHSGSQPVSSKPLLCFACAQSSHLRHPLTRAHSHSDLSQPRPSKVSRSSTSQKTTLRYLRPLRSMSARSSGFHEQSLIHTFNWCRLHC